MEKGSLVICGSFSQSTLDIVAQYESAELQVEQVPYGSPAKVIAYLPKPNVVLVLVNEGVYEQIKGYIDQGRVRTGVNKLHVYKDDNALKLMLIERWGTPNEISAPLQLVSSVEDLNISGNASLLEDKDTEISSLKEQLAQSKMIIEELNRQAEEQGTDEAEFTARIRSLNVDLEAKREEIEQLTNELNSVKAQLAEQANVSVDTSATDAEIANLHLELERVQAELQAEKERSAGIQFNSESSNTELFNANTRITVLEGERDNLTAEVENLRTQVDELKGSLSLKDTEIQDLTAKLADAQANQEVKQQLEETETLLKNANVDLSNRIEETNQIKAERDRLKEENATLAEKSLELDAVRAELQNIQGQLTDYDRIKNVESELHETQAQLEECKSSLKSVGDEKDRVVGELATSQAENTKLSNSLELKSKQLGDVTAERDGLKQKVTDLENNVMELKREKIEVGVKLETAQRLADSKNAAELELRNSELQGIVDGLNEEIESLRHESATTAIPRVFKEMSNESGYLKGATTLKLDVSLGLADRKCILVADGSNESSMFTAEMIERTCKFVKDKRILVLDLTLDTKVDVKFKADQKGAVDWLAGDAPLNKVIASTTLKNVKYIGLVGAYANETALLSVDWDAKIGELLALADEVIIHIGSIVNLVPRILYNTFKGWMTSYITLSAVPTSVRACIFSVWGMKEIRSNNTKLIYMTEAGLINSYTSSLLEKLESRVELVKAQAATILSL